MTDNYSLKVCLNCNATENDIPLINLNYSGKLAFICSRCLPLLIHQPEKLVGKLDRAEDIPSAKHGE